ncbi:MAG: hypothetical protein ACJAT2_003092 [Bacteriovoracaceae bacterium]|jgi:hypothetical protein
MRLNLAILLILLISVSCATKRKEVKAEVKPEREQSTLRPRSTIPKEYLEVLAFISNNQRKIINEIVDQKGPLLKKYSDLMGVSEREYQSFKDILKQNLPKLIQYNEADAFQFRVQELLLDKKIKLSSIRPQNQ